jgi:hypothetical protein
LAKLVPSVLILKLKLGSSSSPHNRISMLILEGVVGKISKLILDQFQSGKFSPHTNTPIQCAIEKAMSPDPEILSLAITLCGRNRLSRWPGLHFENTSLDRGKLHLATGFTLTPPQQVAFKDEALKPKGKSTSWSMIITLNKT